MWSIKRIGIATVTACCAIGVIAMVAFGADPTPEAAPAASKLTAEEILKQADAKVAGFDDSYMKIEMTVSGVESGQRSKILEMFQKGDEMRLIRFLAPGDVKGMNILVKDHDHVYIYMPSRSGIRRVAAHNMSQGVAGSDFTNEDMAQASYARDYTATLASETATEWALDCVPKKGVATEWTKLVIRVVKGTMLISSIEYHKGDKAMRRMTNENVKEWAPGLLRAIDNKMTNLQTNHWTLMKLSEYKVNQGYPDSMFTERYLQWGR